jgi:hypothetical protein
MEPQRKPRLIKGCSTNKKYENGGEGRGTKEVKWSNFVEYVKTSS